MGSQNKPCANTDPEITESADPLRAVERVRVFRFVLSQLHIIHTYIIYIYNIHFLYLKKLLPEVYRAWGH